MIRATTFAIATLQTTPALASGSIKDIIASLCVIHVNDEEICTRLANKPVHDQ